MKGRFRSERLIFFCFSTVDFVKMQPKPMTRNETDRFDSVWLIHGMPMSISIFEFKLTFPYFPTQLRRVSCEFTHLMIIVYFYRVHRPPRDGNSRPNGSVLFKRENLHQIFVWNLNEVRKIIRHCLKLLIDQRSFGESFTEFRVFAKKKNDYIHLRFWVANNSVCSQEGKKSGANVEKDNEIRFGWHA